MRFRLRRRHIVDLFALASMLFAFVITHVPAPSGVGTSEDDPSRKALRGFWYGLRDLARAGRDRGYDLPDALASDKAIHFAIYLGPGFWWALSLLVRGRLDARNAALLLGLLAVWAGLDELSQALLAREGELADVLANVAGAAIGIALAFLLRLAARVLSRRWETAFARR